MYLMIYLFMKGRRSVVRLYWIERLSHNAFINANCFPCMVALSCRDLVYAINLKRTLISPPYLNLNRLLVKRQLDNPSPRAVQCRALILDRTFVS